MQMRQFSITSHDPVYNIALQIAQSQKTSLIQRLTAENLILQRASSSIMCHRRRHVGCRLEILIENPYSLSDIPAIWNMQPQGVSTVRYWQMTLWWIYMAKTIIYMHIWLSGVFGYLHKASCVLSFHKNILFNRLVPLMETSEPT